MRIRPTELDGGSGFLAGEGARSDGRQAVVGALGDPRVGLGNGQAVMRKVANRHDGTAGSWQRTRREA
jgi:hypothetical protein